MGRVDGGEGRQAALYLHHLGRPTLTLAGLWDRCETSDEGVVESFTIITQPAGSPLNGYHDRALVVIWQEDRKRWLTLGHDGTDLLGPENPGRVDVEAITSAKSP